MEVFLGDFSDVKDIERKFKLQEGFIGEGHMEFRVLLACYGGEDYKGRAFILMKGVNSKLWEVNAYHCSCYELEGQWLPEQTSIAALRFRMENGSLGKMGGLDFTAELKEVLDRLEENEKWRSVASLNTGTKFVSTSCGTLKEAFSEEARVPFHNEFTFMGIPVEIDYSKFTIGENAITLKVKEENDD